MFLKKIRELLLKGFEFVKRLFKKVSNLLKREEAVKEPEVEKYTIDHGDYGNLSYVLKKDITIDHGIYGVAQKSKPYVKNVALSNNKVKLEEVTKNTKIEHGIYGFNSIR